MLKLRIWWADLLYTAALKKWLKYRFSPKSYKYFLIMKKRVEKLNNLEARLK